MSANRAVPTLRSLAPLERRVVLQAQRVEQLVQQYFIAAVHYVLAASTALQRQLQAATARLTTWQRSLRHTCPACLRTAEWSVHQQACPRHAAVRAGT